MAQKSQADVIKRQINLLITRSILTLFNNSQVHRQLKRAKFVTCRVLIPNENLDENCTCFLDHIPNHLQLRTNVKCFMQKRLRIRFFLTTSISLASVKSFKGILIDV